MDSGRLDGHASRRDGPDHRLLTGVAPDHSPEAWPRGRARHGGVDEVPLPARVAGRLWLAGKHFVAPDPVAALASVGASMVLCLCEEGELAERYPGYVTWLRSEAPLGWAWWHPIPDLHAPPLDEADALIATVASQLRDGAAILAHCGAGIGRAGTLAAAVLIHFGASLDSALATVAAARPMAGPEAGPQMALLEELAGAPRREPDIDVSE